MIFLLKPLLVLVKNKKLVELLTIEFQLILSVLSDSFVVSDIILLCGEERLEAEDGWKVGSSIFYYIFSADPFLRQIIFPDNII